MGLIRGVVKIIGVVMTLITSALLLAFGIGLFFRTKYEIWDATYREVDAVWIAAQESLPEFAYYRQVIGALIVIFGLLVLWSLLIRGKKRRRSISFVGMHGDVTIELEHVEGTLEKVALKLPEVRDVAIRLEPTEARSRVLVLAQAILLKDADVEAKQVTDRVQEYLRIHTQKILGVQEVDVRLTVRKFHMNMKTLKPMPLLLSGPENATAVAKVMNDDRAAPPAERKEEAAQPS